MCSSSMLTKRVLAERRRWPEEVQARGLPDISLDGETQVATCGAVQLHLAGTFYPFRPPSILVAQGASTVAYAKFLQQASQHHDLPAFTLACATRPELMAGSIEFGACACCTSVTCYANWLPCRTLADIVSEAHFWLLYDRLCKSGVSDIFRNRRWFLDDDVLHLIVAAAAKK